MPHIVEAAAVLAVMLAGAAAVLLAVRFWIGAAADLIWMSILRPRPTVSAIVCIGFVVLVLVYGLAPPRATPFVALPLLAVVLITPVLARPLTSLIVQRLFTRMDYAFTLEKSSLRLANVFVLEELQLRTVYTAPENKLRAPAEDRGGR